MATAHRVRQTGPAEIWEVKSEAGARLVDVTFRHAPRDYAPPKHWESGVLAFGIDSQQIGGLGIDRHSAFVAAVAVYSPLTSSDPHRYPVQNWPAIETAVKTARAFGR